MNTIVNLSTFGEDIQKYTRRIIPPTKSRNAVIYSKLFTNWRLKSYSYRIQVSCDLRAVQRRKLSCSLFKFDYISRHPVRSGVESEPCLAAENSGNVEAGVRQLYKFIRRLQTLF